MDKDECSQKILHTIYVSENIRLQNIQQDSKQMTSEHDTLCSVTSSYVMMWRALRPPELKFKPQERNANKKGRKRVK